MHVRTSEHNGTLDSHRMYRRQDSNLQYSAYKADALPTGLLRQFSWLGTYKVTQPKAKHFNVMTMVHVYVLHITALLCDFLDSILIASLPDQSCSTELPDWAPQQSSIDALHIGAGVMMSSFNGRRSKMDGTAAWHLSK